MVDRPTGWQARLTGRTLLVTGHTGFVGSWLSALAAGAGATVIGMARREPVAGAYVDLGVADAARTMTCDITDRAGVLAIAERVQPDAIVHLAAVSSVKRAAANPALAYDVNVLGTVNALEAARSVPDVRVVLAAGSLLGSSSNGAGPYVASKRAAAEAVEAYRSIPSRASLVRVEFPNLIGGGDASTSRLVPAAVAALASGRAPQVRNPAAKRTWLHVADAAACALALVADVLDGRTVDRDPLAGAETATVGAVIGHLVSCWSGQDHGTAVPRALGRAIEEVVSFEQAEERHEIARLQVSDRLLQTR